MTRVRMRAHTHTHTHTHTHIVIIRGGAADRDKTFFNKQPVKLEKTTERERLEISSDKSEI